MEDYQENNKKKRKLIKKYKRAIKWIINGLLMLVGGEILIHSGTVIADFLVLFLSKQSAINIDVLTKIALEIGGPFLAIVSASSNNIAQNFTPVLARGFTIYTLPYSFFL